MKISFASGKLKKQLTDKNKLMKAYGRLARPLMRRLGVLAAARSLEDVPRAPPDRCHQLKGDRDERFAVDLSRNKRLEFEPDHEPIPRKLDGGIKLDEVTDIKIIGVDDYH